MLRGSNTSMASMNSSGNNGNGNNNNNNRERTHTGGSTGSWGGGVHSTMESGRLRERSGTDGSIRSTGSIGSTIGLNDGGGHSETVPLATTTVRRSNSDKLQRNGSNKTTTRRRKFVDWIQRQRLPNRSSNTNTNTSNTTASAEGVPLIAGLDRVLFGTQSAADAIQIAGMQPPRYLWYMLSGAMCDVIQFLMDVLLYFTFHIEDASTCWAISFSLSVYFRHISHRWLVFGDYVGGYKSSLIRMYGGYSVIIVLSTVFNILMTKMASISHYVAWILTLLWTGIANYFILKKLWSFGGPSAAVATTAAGTKQ
jgi:hypothetical protein